MYQKNVIIGAKDIIEQTKISDSTVRRILRKFLNDKKIESTDNNDNSSNKKSKTQSRKTAKNTDNRAIKKTSNK